MPNDPGEIALNWPRIRRGIWRLAICYHLVNTTHFLLNQNMIMNRPSLQLFRSAHYQQVLLGIAIWLLSAGSWALAGDVEVPTIDLDNRSDLQVVVDRQPGQYLGHPTTLLLEDGKTILCVYPKGHGKGAILYKRSSDGGMSWSDHLPTPKSWETSKETPTIHRVLTKDGKKRILLFSGLHPVRQSISDDDGLSWTELAPIGGFGGIVTMASVVPVLSKPGSYTALFHDDGRYIHPRPNPVRGRFTRQPPAMQGITGLTRPPFMFLPRCIFANRGLFFLRTESSLRCFCARTGGKPIRTLFSAAMRWPPGPSHAPCPMP